MARTELSEDEREWLFFEGAPINRSESAVSIPMRKLLWLMNLRAMVLCSNYSVEQLEKDFADIRLLTPSEIKKLDGN